MQPGAAPVDIEAEGAASRPSLSPSTSVPRPSRAKGFLMLHSLSRATVLAAALAAGGWLSTLGAQAPETPDLRLTPARADALALALRDGLPSVPGEVLVKFKAGS